MNQTALVKRAFAITRRYRVLWLFGILVALTGGGGGSGSGVNYSFQGDELQRRGITLPPELANFDPSRYIGRIIVCCSLLLILGVAALIVSYVARTARSTGRWIRSRPPARRPRGEKASAWGGATGRSGCSCWS